MTRSSTPTRERILTASLELMRRHGYAGTGVKAVLVASEAPYGSLYHHFPGGKEELAAETLRQAGRAYLELVEAYFPAGADVATAAAAFFNDAADVVESTDFIDACPIATVAGEIASSSEPMRLAAADAFQSWLAAVTECATAGGVDPTRARSLAIEAFCALEGAFLLSRTLRDAEPIRIAGRAVAASARAAATA